MARWLESLAEFDFTMQHRRGNSHNNADGISRKTCEDCKQCNRIEQRDGGPSHKEIHTSITSNIYQKDVHNDLSPAQPQVSHVLTIGIESVQVNSKPLLSNYEQKISALKLQTEGEAEKANTNDIAALQQQMPSELFSIYKCVKENCTLSEIKSYKKAALN